MSKFRKYMLGLIGVLVLIIGYAVIFGERSDEPALDCDAGDLSEEDAVRCIVNDIDGKHFGNLSRLDVIGSTLWMDWRVGEFVGFTDDAYEDIVRVVCELRSEGYTSHRFDIRAHAPTFDGEGTMEMRAVLTAESVDGMNCQNPRAVELQDYTVNYDLRAID